MKRADCRFAPGPVNPRNRIARKQFCAVRGSSRQLVSEPPTVGLGCCVPRRLICYHHAIAPSVPPMTMPAPDILLICDDAGRAARLAASIRLAVPEANVHSDLPASGVLPSGFHVIIVADEIGGPELAMLQSRRRCPTIRLAEAGSETAAAQALRAGFDDYASESGSASESLTAALQRQLASGHSVAPLALLGRALDTSPTGVMICEAGRENPIIYVNRAFEQITGYPADEVINRNPRFLHDHQQATQTALGEVRAAIRDGRSTEVTLQNRRKDGTLYWNRLLIAPVRAPDGELTHWVGIQNDISELVAAQSALQAERAELSARVDARTRELSEANAELERASRLKDEFLANISHELRTPLNGILVLTESLQELVFGQLNEKQLRCVDGISTSGKHLLQLISDILDLSRIEAGRMTLDVTRVNPAELCRRSMSLVKDIAARKQLQTSVEVPEDLPPVAVDERRFRQILVNLLYNAVKFTDAGGAIGIRVGTIDGAVQFTVHDTGCGISEVDQRKLFQPFVQVDGSLERRHEGTGLGLVLVRKLAALHGGSARVESEVGVGSRFIVELPFGDDETTIAEWHKTSHPGGGTSQVTTMKRRLLLVDDNAANRMALGDYLGAIGYNVDTAADGVEAIERVSAGAYHLVLMDVQMPRMDGLEATRRLKALPHTRNVPVVVVSAFAMKGDRERCLAAGADEYLAKPVQLADLRKILDRFLGG
ncbi:MAG: response regulator [Planctomycetota bacterium]